MEEALSNADFIQESAPEHTDQDRILQR